MMITFLCSFNADGLGDVRIFMVYVQDCRERLLKVKVPD